MTVPSRTKRISSSASVEREAPQGESPRTESEAAPAGDPLGAPSGKAKPKKAPKVMMGLLAVAALAGLTIWLLGRGKESTDDAQVEGHIVTVAVRTPGQVARVLVADNQMVKEGDVLVELDLDELKARLAVAKADLMAAEASLALARSQLDLTEKTTTASLRQARGGVSQATSGVVSSKAQVEQAQADLATAESRRQLADKELSRVRELFAKGSVSQAELDARQASADQAASGLDQARARLESTRAMISGNYGGVEQAQGRLVAAMAGPEQVQAAQAQVQLAQARVEQSRSAVRLAELNLSYATVHAPASGVVSRKNVEVGNLVSPDRPILAIVPLNDVWIVANFKEDQIGSMKPGQHATIEIDTYPGRKFSGEVESLAAGTGARFALLPPDNATGNFVKVVQRVPVRLKIADRGQDLLRPGLSASVTVHIQ